MIKIDRLVIRVPASMKPRAAELVRQTAQQLAAAQQTTDQQIDALQPETVLARPETPTTLLARRISESVQNQIHQARGES